jgi:RNA recognition motif-containing protein
MNTKLYVGNLSFQSSEGELQDLFAQYGKVVSAEILMDKMTNRSRGFGFVTMESKEEAQNAIQALNGKNLNGRDLTVNEARPREERGPRNNNNGGNRRRFANNGSGNRW